MSPRTKIIAATLLLGSVFAATLNRAAHVQFPGKPFEQWTAKEAEKILSDSPWAQTQVVLGAAGRLDPVTETADTMFTVRLRSALPVRQALARLNQLRGGYDQKNASERAALDARNKEILECSECLDDYAVSITPGPGSRRDLPAFLSSGRTASELIKQNVVLENDKHETRELTKFVQPKFAAGEAIFFFRRLDSRGKSLIDPGSRFVIISFDPRIFDWKKPTATKFKFDVARLIVDGKVAF